mmetsp:Transcript_130898/g.292142  ORF Transcript_130898/g.292142 Transcript_130898/m.292142 type:complete len:123 (+) Transcript_130898:54-422(+)
MRTTGSTRDGVGIEPMHLHLHRAEVTVMMEADAALRERSESNSDEDRFAYQDYFSERPTGKEGATRSNCCTILFFILYLLTQFCSSTFLQASECSCCGKERTLKSSRDKTALPERIRLGFFS